MKRLFSILLSLCLLLSLLGCSEPAVVRDYEKDNHQTATSAAPVSTTEAVQTAGITPALYRVTDESGNCIWLFGSIHVGLPSFYPLPDYVTDAYKSADALAVECDILSFEKDFIAQMNALDSLIYQDGTKITDHISQELYDAAAEILKESGSNPSMLEIYKPVLWSSFIDNYLYDAIGTDTSLGIDQHFLEDAHETGKEVLEVESVEFQYAMLSGFSEELQILLLEESIAAYHDPEETEKQINALLEAWSTGDAQALSQLLQEEGEFEFEEEALLYQEYSNAMMTQRNLSMADYAMEALASGKEVFICVGAAHIVGSGAMAELLAQKGCTVERITP